VKNRQILSKIRPKWSIFYTTQLLANTVVFKDKNVPKSRAYLGEFRPIFQEKMRPRAKNAPKRPKMCPNGKKCAHTAKK
jgi:hypothetical protein